MFRTYSFLFIFCAGLVVAIYAQKYTHAQTIEEIITVPAAEPVQRITTSAGLLNCYKIKEGFLRGKWVTEHRICQFQHDRSMAWVEEHWTCYKYDAGSCMTWIKWSSGWDKTIRVYVLKTIAKPRHHRYTSWCEEYMPIDPCR